MRWQGTSHKIRHSRAPEPQRPSRVLQITRAARHPNLNTASRTNSPEDVVQHVLTLFRNPDAAEIAQWIVPHDFIPSERGPDHLRAVPHGEGGDAPLASLAHALDVGARRVLPGHLLRRSTVLGTLRLGGAEFQQRIALTARTGEEAVLQWKLVWNDGAQRWLIMGIARDTEASDSPLPSTPHPKNSPEAVVKAQVAALARGDVFTAAGFNTLGIAPHRTTGASTPQDQIEINGCTLGQVDELQQVLAGVQHAPLARLEEAVLGPATLLTQRAQHQEVAVREAGGQRGSWIKYVWGLELQPGNLCWMTTSIDCVHGSEF